MLRPEWALRMVMNGGARFRNLEPYADRMPGAPITKFIGQQLNGTLDWDYLDAIRDAWPGKMMLKGILDGQDAERAMRQGCDALIISNHGGRQLDAAPHPLDVLPQIRAVVGKKMPLIVDSGIASGLDIVKALASGADFVLIGRAFMYAVAALGKDGADHAANVLAEELADVMAQLGIDTIKGLRDAKLSYTTDAR
jgi:L-lactate dehydrogenase (cytochrome)